MATPRQPQDHKKPAEEVDPGAPFAFDHNGEHYELAPIDSLAAGFLRANRRRTPDDQFWTILEALADEDALAAIDDMKRDEIRKFQTDFFAHIGANPGELQASSS